MAETTNRVRSCSTGEILAIWVWEALLRLHQKLTLYLFLYYSMVPGVAVSQDQDVVVQRLVTAAAGTLAPAKVLAAGKTQQILINVGADDQ